MYIDTHLFVPGKWSSYFKSSSRTVLENHLEFLICSWIILTIIVFELFKNMLQEQFKNFLRTYMFYIVMEIFFNILTHLCQMYLPILINWTSPFSILGLLGGIFHFYSNLKRNFCKQTVENLIRRHILRSLIWVCAVCMCPQKKDARLIWVMNFAGTLCCFWYAWAVLKYVLKLFKIFSWK